MNIEIIAEHPFASVTVESKDLTSQAHCPICASSAGQTLLCAVERSLEFSWCDSCHHLYLNRRPTPEWLADYYKTGFDSTRPVEGRPIPGMALARGVARKSLAVLDTITNRQDTITNEIKESIPNFVSSVMRKGEKVLDIGCGYGWTLGQFKDLGYQAYGVESSAHRAQHTAQKGIPCQRVPVEQLDEKTFGTKFDLVYSNHVLEHVVDPHAFMSAVTSLVDPGKHFCISVPSFYRELLFNQFQTFVHLQVFTPRSLMLLLKKHGFECKKVLVDHQIRILARRLQPGEVPGPDVYPMDVPPMTPAQLLDYVMPNLLPGAPRTADGVLKDGTYCVMWGHFNPATFDYSRIVDQIFDIDVREVSPDQAESFLKSIPEDSYRRVSLCRVRQDGADLPVRLMFKNRDSSLYWTTNF